MHPSSTPEPLALSLALLITLRSVERDYSLSPSFLVEHNRIEYFEHDNLCGLSDAGPVLSPST